MQFLPFWRRQALDASHHGRYGPDCLATFLRFWQSLVRCLPAEYRILDFWVMTSGNVSVFSAYWFNTGYMSTSVYGGFWKIFTYFLCQGGPRMVQFSDKVVEVPVVVQRQVPQFRICSSSRSLTPLLLRSG